MKFKTSLYALPLAGVLAVLAQPAMSTTWDPFFGEVYQVKQASYTGGSYNQQLAANYRSFVIFEADEMYDWIDAKHFSGKAQAAAAGQRVMPENPDDWGIADATALDELRVQHGRLVSALGAGAIEKAPVQVALAQAKFDCWVEQQQEGWQTWDIAACRDAYMAAMRDVDAAMAPKVAAAPPVAPVAAFPVNGYLVYFDFDKSTIRPDAAALLDQVAVAAREQKAQVVELTAYTDRAGSVDYNQSLSERRALAVRNYLAGRGVIVQHMTSLSLGEADSRVATLDGVREPENRRVTVYLR